MIRPKECLIKGVSDFLNVPRELADSSTRGWPSKSLSDMNHEESPHHKPHWFCNQRQTWLPTSSKGNAPESGADVLECFYPGASIQEDGRHFSQKSLTSQCRQEFLIIRESDKKNKKIMGSAHGCAGSIILCPHMELYLSSYWNWLVTDNF